MALQAVVQGVIPILQGATQHSESIQQTHKLHRDAIKQAALIHELTYQQEARFHSESLRLAKRQHAEDMTHQDNLARRENLRDMWAQTNHRTQALMVSDTLLFGCTFAMVVEGYPPPGAHLIVVWVYTVSVVLSLAALIISVWFAMTLQDRMTQYVISNPAQEYLCKQRFHETFQSYYQCHCESCEIASVRLFYGGAVGLLVSAAALLYARLATRTLSAAIVAVFGIACILLAMIILKLVLPARTRVNDAVEFQSALMTGTHTIRGNYFDAAAKAQAAPEVGPEADYFFSPALPASRLDAVGSQDLRDTPTPFNMQHDEAALASYVPDQAGGRTD